MASTINFKRLVQVEATNVIEDLVEALKVSVLLADSAKRTLWGDEKARSLGGEFPVWLAGRIIGYVLGPPLVYSLASLLSYLSQQELDKREATDKILDKESELSLIRDINSRVAASLDVAEIAMALVDEATSFVESTGASVMLLNEETGRLEIAAAFGRKFDDRPVLRPGVGIVGDVLLTGVPEVVMDVTLDPRFVPGAYPVCSLICVPITTGERVIGAINISNQRPANYGEAEVKHVLALAMHAATAIEKARQHERVLNGKPKQPLIQGFAQLLDKPGNGDLAPGDSCKENISVLFCGIRSYAEHYSSMTPRENFVFINDYLEAICLPILRSKGILGRFEGDGVMALFPDQDGKGPDQAVMAAIEMHRDLRDFSERRRKASKMPVEMGIGLHTGLVSVGVIELQEDLKSTVLGDSVGIAARMERLSKLYGLRVAISGNTYDALSMKPLAGIREADMVTIPGKEITLTLYDVYGADPDGIREAKQKHQAAFNEALGLFRHREWGKAGRIFSRLCEFMPFDRLSMIYWKRCQAFKKSPPGESWVGVSRISAF
ncbi:MAG: GAF domain-containing protein [Desulfatibacillum sp.]|nr:GAF domain-containing protein [Desulfatibacillum sp.]